MSNWKHSSIKQAADSVREAMQGNLRSQHTLAACLKKLKNVLDDGEFVRFLMDERDGLGLAQATAYKYERMVSALDVIPQEAVWEKVGWSGVTQVARVENRNERVSVCRAIVRSPSTVSMNKLVEILESKAPSYSNQRGSRRPVAGISKSRAIREREILVNTMTKLLKEFKMLRRKIPEEVEIILGLKDQDEREAQAS